MVRKGKRLGKSEKQLVQERRDVLQKHEKIGLVKKLNSCSKMFLKITAIKFLE